MIIHFLNCASIYPPFVSFGVGTLCILLETNRGLALVDCALGRHDHQHPAWQVRVFKSWLQVPDTLEETAVHQITRLGYHPEEVQDIILTHLHFDHAGGLPDFSHSRVHLFRPEYDAWQNPHRFLERVGYNQACFAHGPKWELYEFQGERWYDFEALRLPGFEPEMWLVPLVGHTSGHCGVAIRRETGWLLHCGDALVASMDTILSSPRWLAEWAIGPHFRRLLALQESHPEIQTTGGHMPLSFFHQEHSE